MNLTKETKNKKKRKKMVGRQGFEPWTNGLKGRCSTAELPTHSINALMSNFYECFALASARKTIDLVEQKCKNISIFF